MFPVKGVKADRWITLTVCDISQHVGLKQSPFLQGPYLRQSRLYLPNGPSCRYTTVVTHRWHRGGQTRALTAPDLICFNLREKTRHIKGEKKKNREGGFHRWNEKLMLQRSVKPSKGSTLGQPTGGFFFSVLAQITWIEYGGGCRQLSRGRWICHKRATNFKNFFIYDAKHALPPHTRGPLLEHNQAAWINGQRALGRFISFGGIVKILEMEEHGPSGKMDDRGAAEVTFGKKPKLPKEAWQCVFHALQCFYPLTLTVHLAAMCRHYQYSDLDRRIWHQFSLMGRPERVLPP